MRALLLLALTACHDMPATEPDAGTDAGITPGGEYWPCFAWDGPVRCAPKCANKTLLGRPTFGPGCTTAVGQCPDANMTGPDEFGGACCVVQGERVELVACE